MDEEKEGEQCSQRHGHEQEQNVGWGIMQGQQLP